MTDGFIVWVLTPRDEIYAHISEKLRALKNLEVVEPLLLMEDKVARRFWPIEIEPLAPQRSASPVELHAPPRKRGRWA